MSTQPLAIAVLTENKSILPNERDIRLEDYLNDKFQTASDFADLDDLISNIEGHASQIQAQLQDATNKLAEAKRASQNHTAAVLKQTADFQAQQSSISQRLAAISGSDETDDAVAKLDAPMEKLRRLELASTYVELLLEVDQLADTARSHLPGDVNAALKPYIRLKGFAENLVKLQPAADDAATHIVAHVQFRQEQLYQQMKGILENHFKELLGRQNWTAPGYQYGTEFCEVFKKLLDLQAPELACDKVLILLPMKVLTDKHVTAFWYHFMREETKTALNSKPKQFLDWVLNLIEEYQPPLVSIVGPILAGHFKDSKLSRISIYIDPVAAWITAFLPIVKKKVISYLRKCKADSSEVHDMIIALIDFDRNLMRRFAYDGGSTPWTGIAGEVLEDWFDVWLSKEKTFAVERYKGIIGETKNAAIDHEYYGHGKTKPTVAAALISDLINNITKTYRRAPNNTHKFRFLIEVQIAILLQYDELLRGSLEAYKTNTTTVGRTLNAVSKEQQQALEGLGGLESLCKVLGSAEHMVNNLKDWSNEPFFVDLFEELRTRAILKKDKINSNLASPLSYTFVKNRTSLNLDDEGKDASLFDQTIEDFKFRKDEAESLIKEAIKYVLPKVFRPFTTRPDWATIDESSKGQIPLSSIPNVTAELEEPLRWLDSYMTFLYKAVSTVLFRRIWSSALSHLEEILWSDIIMRSNFTNLGAAHFIRDATAIWDTVERYIPGASASKLGMPKVREAAVLLNLPVKEAVVDKDREGGKWTLDGVNDLLFSSNEEAKGVVRDLGLELLTHWDARSVVQRRVECAP